MKKTQSIVAIVVVLIVIVGGGYLLLHESNKSSSANSNSSQATPVNNSVLITKTSSSLGQYLAEPDGRALYTYNADTSGVSNCTGSCLASWPAYIDNGSTTGLPSGVSTMKRTDNGQTQYTYNGLPLYTFVGDQGNQATGNGVQNFTLAKPSASSSSSSTPASPSPSNSSNTNSNSNPYNY